MSLDERIEELERQVDQLAEFNVTVLAMLIRRMDEPMFPASTNEAIQVMKSVADRNEEQGNSVVSKLIDKLIEAI